MMTNIDVYKAIFKKVFEVSDDEVVQLKKGEDRWDSIMHMELVAELEDAFKVKLKGRQIMSINTYETGISALAATGVEFDN